MKALESTFLRCCVSVGLWSHLLVQRTNMIITRPQGDLQNRKTSSTKRHQCYPIRKLGRISFMFLEVTCKQKVYSFRERNRFSFLLVVIFLLSVKTLFMFHFFFLILLGTDTGQETWQPPLLKQCWIFLRVCLCLQTGIWREARSGRGSY